MLGVGQRALALDDAIEDHDGKNHRPKGDQAKRQTHQAGHLGDLLADDGFFGVLWVDVDRQGLVDLIALDVLSCQDIVAVGLGAVAVAALVGLAIDLILELDVRQVVLCLRPNRRAGDLALNGRVFGRVVSSNHSSCL